MTTSPNPIDGWTVARAGGVGLLCPDDWELMLDVPEVALIARSPHPSIDGFVANVTIVVRPTDLSDPEAILDEQLLQLSLFPDAVVLDGEETELARRPATRALIAWRSDAHELTLEQWIVPLPDTLVTISATSASCNHAEASAVLDAILSTVTIDG